MKIEDIMKQEKKLYMMNNPKKLLKGIICREHGWIIWRYMVWLRREEKYEKRKIYALLRYYCRRRRNIIGERIGFTIGLDALCGPTLIWHYGSIVINGHAKIGQNCILHGRNCIGNNGYQEECPTIGDNVEFGVGASAIGDIYIANGIKIGAGAIVVNSFYEEGITIAGIPARRVRY